MDLEELQETEIWTLYEKMKNYNMEMDVYSDTDKNYRMYNGDQWNGVKLEDIKPVSLNIIKPIVKYKLAVLHQNDYGINYSAENIKEGASRELANKTCELLNNLARKVWEKDRFDKKVRRMTKDAAINDEGIIYVTYNKEDNMPINEVIYKNDIGYGNENSDEIQTQPYIIIRQRKTVLETQALAKASGVNNAQVENITGDNDTQGTTGEDAKNEVNDACWLLTKIWKGKDGFVHFSQATRFVDIIEDETTEITRYPLVHMNWEEKAGSARGEGEVRQLIPNQLEINKIIMRRLIVSKKTAYPQTVVNTAKVRNPKAINRIGSTIETNDQTVDDVRKIINTTTPAQMSTDVDKLQNDLIQLTRELAGAGDAATGDVNPTDASGRAILAVQNASKMPMTEQLETLKDTLDQLAKIWLDMWKAYAVDGLVIEDTQKDELTGEETTRLVQVPYEILEKLDAEVKVDVTPKSPYDKFSQEISIENMLKAGYFRPENLSQLEVYVSLLDDDSSMPKHKMEEAITHIKKQQEEIDKINAQAQELQAQADKFMGEQQDITAMGEQGANLYEEAQAL